MYSNRRTRVWNAASNPKRGCIILIIKRLLWMKIDPLPSGRYDVEFPQTFSRYTQHNTVRLVLFELSIVSLCLCNKRNCLEGLFLDGNWFSHTTHTDHASLAYSYLVGPFLEVGQRDVCRFDGLSVCLSVWAQTDLFIWSFPIGTDGSQMWDNVICVCCGFWQKSIEITV